MLRTLLIIPTTIAIVAAIGLAVCGMLGFSPSRFDVIAAAMTCLLAGELALIPLLMWRNGNQLVIAQAALIGSLVHLAINIVLAMIALLGKLGVGQPYLFWLLSFYWTSLIVLVVMFVKAVRTAPAVQSTTVPRS